MRRSPSFEQTVIFIGIVIVLIVLAGCVGGVQERPEPEIRIVETKVKVPIPCPELEELGAEPVYPDTDQAVRVAPNIFERMKLLLRGRLLRTARLGQYQAARASC